MRKSIIHMIIWLLGVIGWIALEKLGFDSGYGIVLLWSMCALFFIVNYLYTIFQSKNKKKIRVMVSSDGVSGARICGIMLNMFVVQYILELYLHLRICGILCIVSVIVLWVLKKEVYEFFFKNIWKTSYYWIYCFYGIK